MVSNVIVVVCVIKLQCIVYRTLCIVYCVLVIVYSAELFPCPNTLSYSAVDGRVRISTLP